MRSWKTLFHPRELFLALRGRLGCKAQQSIFIRENLTEQVDAASDEKLEKSYFIRDYFIEQGKNISDEKLKNDVSSESVSWNRKWMPRMIS